MNTEILLLSPEKTVLSYRLASLGSRIGAQIVDIFLVGVVLGTIAVLLSIFAQAGALGQTLEGLSTPSLIAAGFLYFILQEGLWNGQTLGKKAAGIRVRMADGTPITFQAALGRNLLRVADWLPSLYFVGLAAIFTTPRAQRFGDLVSGTIVIHEKRGTPNFAPAPHRLAGEHPYEQYVGDLRGLTLEEYRALRRFCDRYPELPATIQSRMVDEIWRPIALRRHVPQMPGVHPLLLAEATVMKYGRMNGLL